MQKGRHNAFSAADYGGRPLIVPLDRFTKANSYFRTALWTGKHFQMTLMSIPVGGDIGLEVHPDVLFRRLRVAKQQRPILQGKEDEELKAFIVQALEKRAPFYHQAQYIFNADELEDRWQIETSVQCLRQLLGL